LLCDPKAPEQAQCAFPEKIDLYCKVQRVISERLAAIGADPAGRDAARLIRVPGSLHTGSERYVQWLIQCDSAGGFIYTLQHLACFFGVPERELHKRSKSAFDRQRNPNKANGWKALNDYRLRDFETLRSLRGGGFDEGHRNSAALVWAWLLRHSGATRDETERAVVELGRESRPPLSYAQCKGAVKSVFDRKIRFSERTIADRLDITPAESAVLQRYPPATRFHLSRPSKPEDAPPPRKAPSAETRRAVILEIVQQRGGCVLELNFSERTGMMKQTIEPGRPANGARGL
jgi:hypothetical protein